MKTIATLVLFLSSVSAFAANTAYVTAKGARQGVFHTETTETTHRDAIPVSAVSFEVLAPSSGGMPTGRRQYKPITLTKEWGASTPQFLSALASNEILSEVVISFFTASRDGREILTSTIKLTNASVVDVKQDASVRAGETVTRNLQDIALTFQKIEITDTQSGVVFVDDTRPGPTP